MLRAASCNFTYVSYQVVGYDTVYENTITFGLGSECMTYNQSTDELSDRQRRNLEIVERHVMESHKSKMKEQRLERDRLRHDYQRRFGGAALFEFSKRFRVFPLLLLLPCLLFAQVPPMPPPLNPLGRQSPYITVVDVRVTNVVTTVQVVSYSRFIRVWADATNTYFKTNYQVLDTNLVSSVTNVSRGAME